MTRDVSKHCETMPDAGEKFNRLIIEWGTEYRHSDNNLQGI